MFKVTIWYRTPASNLSHGIQALIPDSIAATLVQKLASREISAERTSFQNPDVTVLTNTQTCQNSAEISVIIGAKILFNTSITGLSTIYARIRYAFAESIKQYGVRTSENDIVLAIVPASDTYRYNGYWSVEQSPGMLPSWEIRLGDPPPDLIQISTYGCNQYNPYIGIGTTNRLPGLDMTGQSNNDTGLSADIIRGGTLDPDNNPNPDYTNPNNQNRGSNIPIVPIVGGVLVASLLVAIYLNQRERANKEKK